MVPNGDATRRSRTGSGADGRDAISAATSAKPACVGTAQPKRANPTFNAFETRLIIQYATPLPLHGRNGTQTSLHDALGHADDARIAVDGRSTNSGALTLTCG